MEIQGYFTEKGLELSAKLAAGAALTITRVLAGSGRTAESGAAFDQPRQTLAVNTPVCRENTAAIPVTLAAAQAVEDYLLAELGVYARDPDEGEVLYKLYRLDSPVEITAGSRLVLRFYLEETVGQSQEVTVNCSPAGLLTEADLDPVRKPVLACAAGAESVPLTADELPDYIAALPRLLTKHITITVSGVLTKPLDIRDFYGSGALSVCGASLGECTVQNTTVTVCNCSVPVELKQMAFTDSGAAAATSHGASLMLRRTPLASVADCSFAGDGTGRAVMATGLTTASLERLTIQDYDTAVDVWDGGTAVLTELSGADNAYGICVYNGGTARLSGTDLLLGGVANYNDSGVIVRGGSLI